MDAARSMFFSTIGLVVIVLLVTATGVADDSEDETRWFGGETRHRTRHLGRDDEGNEAAGQMAAWLLVPANLPAAVSILIQWTTKSSPAPERMKRALVRFNRFQKRHLMRLHYLVNPLVLGDV